jgi:predicted dehydrogenase
MNSQILGLNEASNGESKLTIGIMSTSSIVDKVLPALRQHFNIAGVASRDPIRASKFCSDRGLEFSKGYSHNDMLADPSIDAVYIPLGSAIRNDFIRSSILAKKHVYLEKPMGGTIQDIENLIELAKENKVQWFDGTMWFHSRRTKEISSKLQNKVIGDLHHVNSSFTFKAPNDEWLNGGNGRTDKTLEPMGCLGDQGWYPLAAILFAFGFNEMPIKVMASSFAFNSVDTIVSCAGTLWFEGGKLATFNCGCTCAHISQFEIVGTNGSIVVNDLVGGQGRTGNFSAYEEQFVGSDTYVQGDMMGLDTKMHVESSDHVDDLVTSFISKIKTIKSGGNPDSEWPKRSLMIHTVMSKIFESVMSDGDIIKLTKV